MTREAKAPVRSVPRPRYRPGPFLLVGFLLWLVFKR